MENKKVEYEDLTDEEFILSACNAALCYCPPIYKCPQCGHAAVQGYCCNHCGYSGGSPEETFDGIPEGAMIILTDDQIQSKNKREAILQDRLNSKRNELYGANLEIKRLKTAFSRIKEMADEYD